MLDKNDVYELRIDGLTSECDGVGRVDGMAVFVEQALPGDVVKTQIVKAKKSYAHGKLIELIRPSPDRVEPPCPVYRRCGGCSLQHCSYSGQLKLKRQKVADAMARIGGFADLAIPEAIGMDEPFRYRNKAQFPVALENGEAAIGFYARRSHSIVQVDSCLIQAKICDAVISSVKEYMSITQLEPYDELTHSGLLRHIAIRTGGCGADEEVMICLVVNGTTIPDALLLKRICLKNVPGLKTIVLNKNTKRSNTILSMENEILLGSGFIRQNVGDLLFELSPLSFFQVNSAQTKPLFDVISDYAGLTGSETVIDAYCGAGAISLYLAGKAKKVYGVDIVDDAIKDANRNMKLNGISNAEFIAGAAEAVLPELIENGAKADIVVADPPRKGCEPKVLSAVMDLSPEKIVYVSCDPATLARDAKILCQGGYRLEKLQPFDMFPMTSHVETIVLLQRRDA
ncbi:MAG: 23S rRNA (uracil(1939)-C(5))-methyltransferase RlmD [Clostridiales bacterium]|jgi:23S rRNA (uracil1939-C5)-methyltransferase|nr:23S rRNA (uracil(1939)-C(5))-methyltransferase RlmD [Clostridiales bacterium]